MSHDESERTGRPDAGASPGATAEATCHEEAWRLLPWYVNGTLQGSELAAVEAHVSACGICRQEVRTWSGFAELLQEEGELAPSAAEGFERLDRRIRPPELEQPPLPPRRSHPGGAGRRVIRSLRHAPAGLRWALAAQLAAIVVLAVSLTAVLAGRPGQGALGESGTAPTAEAAAPFRTLTDPVEPGPASATPTSPRLRVVFKESAREREIRGALISVGGRIVDGPSPTGVYTIQLAEPAGAEAVSGPAAAEALRSLPQVLFAEVVRTP